MTKLLNKIFHKRYDSLNKNIIKKYNDSRVDEHNKILKKVKKDKLLICYAPFNNIFFNCEGQITACCRSHFIFDSYSKKDLKEIWFGSQFEKIRKPIINGALSEACNTCRYSIENNDFDNVMARIFDKNDINENKYPTVLEFELTNICNLECIMCKGILSSSIRKNREKLPSLPMIYDDRFIEQLKDFIPFIKEAKFYGGEPFLINIYYDIIDLIIKINPDVRISITTNGTILNDRIKNLLNKIKFNINISIESLNKDNFESIRVNAKFDTVMENLIYYKNYCNSNNTVFYASITPMRQNWKEIPDIITYFNNINTLVSFNTVYDPPNCALWNLEQEEIKNIFNSLSKHNLPENNNIQKHNKTIYSGLLNQLNIWQKESYENKKESFNLINS